MSLVRFGVSIDEDLLKKYDRLIQGVYDNRSEAIRDMIRNKIIEQKWENSKEEVIGSLTLLYDHHQRGLTKKLLDLQHDHHGFFKSNLHIHVTHDYCLEVIIVKGKAGQLQRIAKKIIGIKGVKHGKLTITSADGI